MCHVSRRLAFFYLLLFAVHLLTCHPPVISVIVINHFLSSSGLHSLYTFILASVNMHTELDFHSFLCVVAHLYSSIILPMRIFKFYLPIG